MAKKNVVCSSAILGKEMHVAVHGTKGLPVIVFPTLGQPAESLEEAGVVAELADYVDSGTIQLFCTDTVDAESWGNPEGDPAARAERQETFYHYVVDELVPLVHKVSKSDARPLALGFDMGATHASIVALRRPDLFQGCVCLSGSYDARRYFGDWMDATLYDNTPCAFLPQMASDHPYVAVYNQRQLLFCCGQDETEADSLRTTRELEANFARLGVDVWCDYWGSDVTHTWFWWRKQLRYFMPIVLEDVEKTTAAEKPAPAKKRATRKRATTAKKAAEKKPAAAKKAEGEVAEPVAAPAAAAAAEAVAAEPAAEKKSAAKKAATTRKAAAAKKPAAKEPAAKKAAAPKAAAKAAAEDASATLAKAEKASAPAKAVKAEVPAKAEKAAVPAKTTKTAAPKAAAPKPAAKATAATAAEKAPAAAEKKAAAPKKAATKTTAKKTTAAKSATTKAAATKATSTKATTAKKTASTKATSASKASKGSTSAE